MGRYSKSTSYGHRIRPLCGGFYRLSWTVDRYYPGSRLRYPTVTVRDTDEAGARRFARRWNVPLPSEKA